ncbi:hypothetical protein PIB30_019205 [Stylosanthes scabra]|uniref:Mei2-like C-terminal RNA recognition motif domain-containing protein n=1 Tax=Stylosanthes scabra TaxID=79078 RepID=A0ABU6Q857_9FABA|nr:hypothetical protein [Stylosanthes scabra]
MPLSVFFIQPNHQEKVRRLVSSVSAVVGLVCYCYSTSFIHLFGQWNWWKILLYLLFSCLSYLAVLFQKEWSIIIPPEHESVSRFLVATSTTIFLFFSDRASKGESDAYGVTSCVSFAVMSLSCGFDELLNVFTGALIVQLMGIKLLLGAVGVVLCFIFIVPTPYLQRYLIESENHHHELQSIQHENHVIVDIDSQQLPSNNQHHHQPQVESAGLSGNTAAENGSPNFGMLSERKKYQLDLKKIDSGEDTRTTLLIKNIPNKYTPKMVLAEIDEIQRGAYDFLYLPVDFKNKCNVGYAFINMVSPSHIIPFYMAFNGKKWEKFNSEKVASLAYTRIQGKAALVSHFQKEE